MFDGCDGCDGCDDDETVVVVKVTLVPSSSGDDGVRSDGGLLFSGGEIPIVASFGCFGVEGDEFVCCFCCVEVQIFSHCSPSCLSFVGLLIQPTIQEINKRNAKFVWCLKSIVHLFPYRP